MLGIEPEAFPMRKDALPLSYIPYTHYQILHFCRTKLEVSGIEPEASPMRKGRSTTELHPLPNHDFSSVLTNTPPPPPNSSISSGAGRVNHLHLYLYLFIRLYPSRSCWLTDKSSNRVL